MNSKEFEESINNQINNCKDILIEKGKEYAQNDVDRLKAFKQAASMQNITPKEALAGMMCKHTCSIYDMCKSKEEYSIEKWEEKITDHINYLLLLKAIIDEEEEYSV